MPCDYSKYPANWLTEIRPDIMYRAMGRCEMCGLLHRDVIRRHKKNPAVTIHEHEISHGMLPPWRRPIRIIITIAHLDHDRTNNDPRNLRALCQRCHNLWDAAHRAESRRKERKCSSQ